MLYRKKKLDYDKLCRALNAMHVYNVAKRAKSCQRIIDVMKYCGDMNEFLYWASKYYEPLEFMNGTCNVKSSLMPLTLSKVKELINDWSSCYLNPKYHYCRTYYYNKPVRPRSN